MVQHHGLLVELGDLQQGALPKPVVDIDPFFEPEPAPALLAKGFDELLDDIGKWALNINPLARSAVPLLISGQFLGLDRSQIPHFMSGLEVLAERAQIIVLTERKSVFEWLSKVDPSRAGAGVFLSR